MLFLNDVVSQKKLLNDFDFLINVTYINNIALRKLAEQSGLLEFILNVVVIVSFCLLYFQYLLTFSYKNVKMDM